MLQILTCVVIKVKESHIQSRKLGSDNSYCKNQSDAIERQAVTALLPY